jgi:hypothetical protein
MTSRIRRALLLAIFASGALALANSRVGAVQAESGCFNVDCLSAWDCRGDIECGCYLPGESFSGGTCKWVAGATTP